MRLVYHDVSLKSIINNIDTNIIFIGKYLNSKNTLRVTPKYFQRQMIHIKEFCNNNFIDIETCDLYFEDIESKKKYRFAYHNSGLKNSYDNGYFLRLD